MNTIKQIFKRESDAIKNIPITGEYTIAKVAMRECLWDGGRIITTGIGKAGLVAQLAAAKFSSMGMSASYVHPVDALHGDMGIISKNDFLIVYSNSGKTLELLTFMRKYAEYVNSVYYSLLITSAEYPEIECNIRLMTGKPEEVCPFGLLPSSSVVAMLAITDVLVVMAMSDKGTTLDEYQKLHHGGYIGEIIKARKK